MKTIFSTLLFFLCISLATNAQIVINGIINTTTGEAVENAYITLTKTNSPIIVAYALSDERGIYSINYKGNADSLCLNISRLDFKKETRCIVNKSQRLDFILQPEITQLREVVVKPAKVWRNQDTVNYSVREFTHKDDRTIADVLKRMPGIEVSQSGRISYNGEPINKFYVEDMDLMGGQYNVISNNLNNKHVEKVQVYENHEPIKALQDKSLSDKAALNLVLKNDAKAKWLASGKFGIGLEPLLWDNELNVMRFAKKMQSTFMYKNNNAGNNISNDLIAHYGLFSTMSKNNLLGIPTSTPSISQTNRYLFNNAHLLTLNNLWKLNKDYELRLNADYTNDYQKRTNNNTIINYLNDEEIVIDEESHTAININKVKASFKLTGNHKNYYLSNTLTSQLDWSDERATINGNEQYLENPYYNLSNNFTWLKTFGYNRIEISSNNRYEKMPQNLYMSPGLYEDIFNEGNDYDILKQQADYHEFKSDNSLIFSRRKGRWNYNYSTGFNGLWQGIDSELGVKNSTIYNDFKNNSTFTDNRYFLMVKLEYTGKKMTGSLSLPGGYQTLSSHDKIRHEKNNHNRLYFQPALFLKYNFNIFWSASLNASYNDNYASIRNYYQGFILQNYRSILRNDGSLSKSESQNYSATISYRDPIKLTNGYITARYTRTHLDYLFEQDFDGILSVRRKVDFGNNIESKSVNGTISKGFDKIIKKILLQSTYRNNTSNQLQMGEPAKYSIHMLTSGLTIESAPLSWLSLFYSFNFSNSTSKLTGNNVDINYGSINRFDHRLKFNFFPYKGLQTGLNLEYENSTGQTNLPDVFFMDVNINYKLKKLEFALNFNNIFNQNKYVVASYGSFYFAKNTYELRPRNVMATIRLSL